MTNMQILTETQPDGSAGLYILAVPQETYKALSDFAAKRNITLAEALQNALSNYLGESDGSTEPSAPRSLLG